MIIDHDPNETPRRSWYWDKGIYLIAWGGVAFIWAMQLKDGFNWEQIGIGAFTGVVFILSVINYTGNKLPGSWRDKPPSR